MTSVTQQCSKTVFKTNDVRCTRGRNLRVHLYKAGYMKWIALLLIGQLTHAMEPVSVTCFVSSTPYITASAYTDSERQLAKLVQTHFDLAKNCWAQQKMPTQRTIRGMTRGTV